MLRGRSVPALLGSLLFSGLAAAGAGPQQAFTTVTASLELSGDSYRGRLQDLWDPGVGITASLETPFYWGQIQLCGSYARMHARESSLPDYWVLLSEIGWGPDLVLPGRILWQARLNAGTQRMHFCDPRASAAMRNEQELSLGATMRVRRPLARGWGIHVVARYQTVMTHIRMRHLWIGAGFSHTWTAPGWLRGFLGCQPAH